ncbi:o-succinylbenzoate synthase [Ruficoccus amylovorans]|uniref:o-succinylbenzoate synthase n=1 Tax=Ruficoccus amylovorans TaxID=1804625 RepID=A0A842HFZ4_9BACT|nr:o-succinylbenzoate synthase [Ruficoccus amylovorans]MBC2595595.1 o-succinylbenzoate synthase [Ruficoccus amylovorans]
MERLAWKPYCRPFRTPLQTAHGDWPLREGLIVRLEREGRVGYGEIAPLEDFGTETLVQAVEFLDARAEDDSLEPPPELVCTRFALDCAAGALETAPARPLHVAGLLPAGITAYAALQVLLDKGFTTFKWKIGVEPIEVERALCAELFKLLHGHGILRLDANAGLSREETEAWMAFLEDYPVEYLEQPLPPGEEAFMAALAGRYSVPVALDESLCGPGALERWSGLFPQGPFIVKPALIGRVEDYRAWRAFHPGVRVIYSSVFETAIGIENALRLAALDEHCAEAAGFGTLESFPHEDQLGWHTYGPSLTAGTLDAAACEELWKRL